MLNGAFSLIKTVMEAFPGFTINDVLDTDYDTLIRTIDAKRPTKEKEQQAMSLKDFVKSI